MIWPDEIPMPREGNFYTGDFNGPGGTHCLIGWSHVAFSDFAARFRFIHALSRAAQRRGGRNAVCFNDDPSTTDADRVAVWDEAAAEFDYERTDEVWP